MNTLSYIKKILRPWRYKNGDANRKLQQALASLYLNSSEKFFITQNGRTAEYLFLMSLNLPKGSKVAVQAFTCNAVINPILWLGLQPLYIDIELDTLSMDIADLKSKVDDATKVIIVQHTFGMSAKVQDIVEFAQSRGILVLEDVAHGLGVENQDGRKLGTFGDVALLSFGIEKILSTRVGGALMVNNEDMLKQIKEEYSKFPNMSLYRTLIWLMNPIFWRILRQLQGLQGGVSKLLNRLGLLNMGFERCELVGDLPKGTPATLSNVLAEIVLEELAQLGENLEHRREISQIYATELSSCNAQTNLERIYWDVPFVRYPLLFKDPSLARIVSEELSRLGYYVGDWYNTVVYPDNTDGGAMRYVPGSCPVAESVAQRTVNLPTGFWVDFAYARKLVEEVCDINS